MPRPDPLTPEVQAAFLAALRDGAGVAGAAASVGVGLGTLYRRRRRDPLFDLAWSSAAELSSPWRWEEAAGRRARAAGAVRRLRFGERRRSAFLAALERCCNLVEAAALTGVSPSTVRRHLKSDPGFAGACAAALGRGFESLTAEWEARPAAVAGRLRARLEPRGEIKGDFDRLMRLLARYERPDGTIGTRRVRFLRKRQPMSFEEAILLVARKMRWMGLLPRPDEDGGEA